MDNIKKLLVEANISEAAATQITEAMESYKAHIRESFEKEYKSKIKRAEKVCEAEVENYKRNLERRIQVFLEAKAADIERIYSKQAAERSTEALTKLNNIAALVEGIEPNGEKVGELKAKLKKLIRDNKQLAEDRNKAIKKANKVMQLAESAQKRNRQLERYLVEGRETNKTIVEGTATRVPTKRLDVGRPSIKPVTTRRTLTENNRTNVDSVDGSIDIAAIADQIS